MTGTGQTPHTYAIVTPCHTPDVERCRLLSESLERYCGIPYHHYILVADDERHLFASMQNAVTTVIPQSRLLTDDFRRVSGDRSGWMTGRGQYVTGWVIQQLLKIAAARFVPHEYIMNVDSDNVFIRPFDSTSFERGSRLRLFRVPDFYLSEFEPWYHAAAECLGTPPYPPGEKQVNFVGNMITWRKAHADAMCRLIEERAGCSWIEKLAGYKMIAEYVLYGTYVEQVVGEKASGHYFDQTHLCHEYWTPQTLDDRELKHFFDELNPGCIAVMISSKSGIEPSRYREFLRHISA